MVMLAGVKNLAVYIAYIMRAVLRISFEDALFGCAMAISAVLY